MYVDLFVGGVHTLRMTMGDVEPVTYSYSEFRGSGGRLDDHECVRVKEIKPLTELGHELQQNVYKLLQFSLKYSADRGWDLYSYRDSILTDVGRYMTEHRSGELDLSLPGVVWPEVRLEIEGQRKIYKMRPEAQLPIAYPVKSELLPPEGEVVAA